MVARVDDNRTLTTYQYARSNWKKSEIGVEQSLSEGINPHQQLHAVELHLSSACHHVDNLIFVEAETQTEGLDE